MEWLGASESSSHREVARRVNAEHFLPVYGGEDVALGYGVPHCGGEPPALVGCSCPLFRRRVSMFIVETPAFPALYTLL